MHRKFIVRLTGVSRRDRKEVRVLLSRIFTGLLPDSVARH